MSKVIVHRFFFFSLSLRKVGLCLTILFKEYLKKKKKGEKHNRYRHINIVEATGLHVSRFSIAFFLTNQIRLVELMTHSDPKF